MSANMTEMPNIYQGAEYAIKSRFYSRNNRIILASEIVNPENGPEIDFVKLKKEIEYLLDRGNKNDIDNLLVKYYSSDMHYSESYIKSLCYSKNVLECRRYKRVRFRAS